MRKQSALVLTLTLLLLPAARAQLFATSPPADAPLPVRMTPLPGVATTPGQLPPGVPAFDLRAGDQPLPPPSEQLGDTLSARGRYLLAIRTFEALPPTAPVLNKLGVACLHMLMFDRARASFAAAMRLDPHYPEAYNNMGTLLHSVGDWNGAEKMYRKALKLRPNSPGTLKNLGTLYYAKGNYRKGDAAYRAALRLDPQALERSGSHDIQASTKTKSAGEVHYHMALSYAEAGSYPMALTYLRKAIAEGFHDRNRLLHEKDFADLRLQPVFLQLVDDLKKD